MVSIIRTLIRAIFRQNYTVLVDRKKINCTFTSVFFTILNHAKHYFQVKSIAILIYCNWIPLHHFFMNYQALYTFHTMHILSGTKSILAHSHFLHSDYFFCEHLPVSAPVPKTCCCCCLLIATSELLAIIRNEGGARI